MELDDSIAVWFGSALPHLCKVYGIALDPDESADIIGIKTIMLVQRMEFEIRDLQYKLAAAREKK